MSTHPSMHTPTFPVGLHLQFQSNSTFLTLFFLHLNFFSPIMRIPALNNINILTHLLSSMVYREFRNCYAHIIIKKKTMKKSSRFICSFPRLHTYSQINFFIVPWMSFPFPFSYVSFEIKLSSFLFVCIQFQSFFRIFVDFIF